MEENLASLIHWDKHRIPVNLTIIFALAVAVFGVYSMLSGAGGAIRPEFIVLLGIGTAVYSWLTNPRTYLIYSDALYIIYGKPRIKRIGFDNISHLEMRTLSTPDRLRVWPVQGRRVVLMARDPELFHGHLQQALDDYRQQNPHLYAIEEPGEDLRPPDGDGGNPPQNPGSNGHAGN